MQQVIDVERLKAETDEHPYPLLFATLSGDHLGGFASPESDFELRGAHILPLEEFVGLLTRQETFETERLENGVRLNMATHDIFKFFSMLLKPNGYLLEQIYSPLVVEAGA